MRLLIAGGGTGGHLFAGLAVAEEWQKKYGPDGMILLVGSVEGMEQRIFPTCGLPYRLLRVGKLNRVSKIQKIKTIGWLPLVFLQSLWILSWFRPRIVLGVGGYSSGPLVFLAGILKWFLPIRVAVLEQNTVMGMTNRWLSVSADVVCTAFPKIQAAPKIQKKAVFTGNPIRALFSRLEPAQTDPFTLFIFGGSQGAMGINSLVLEALPFLKQSGVSFRFIHQTGEADFRRVEEAYKKHGLPARVLKFINTMADCYKDATLLICRSGSSTLAEIAKIGRASLLVPLPTAADDHQTTNAQSFVQAGAALLVSQRQCTGAQFAEKILELVRQPERIRAMERATQGLQKSNAAAEVVEALEQLLNK